MKNVLIEGWRGINQSYAMVNQYQLLELSKLPDMSVHHADVPFASPKWNTTDNNPLFPPAMASVIDGVPSANSGVHYDTVFRIASPYSRSKVRAQKAITFMTAEYGLGVENFPPKSNPLKDIVQGNSTIVTPSSWSRMKLVEFGFPDSCIHIVPHGVSSDIFFPMAPSQRNDLRKLLGLSAEHFVFLNLGAMSANKGIDLVLQAFVEVHRKHPHARLILKDERNLYRLSGVDVVQAALQKQAQQSSAELLAAIKLLSVTLPLYEMRHLYCMADVYVSPYRAEGFNLPVIEAIACGIPVIVTKGGATDDYCEPRTASFVSAQKMDNSNRGLPGTGYTLEPRMDELISNMLDAIENPRNTSDSFNAGRQQLCSDYSWSRCTQKLATLF